jgi:hypothetical protein
MIMSSLLSDLILQVHSVSVALEGEMRVNIAKHPAGTLVDGIARGALDLLKTDDSYAGILEIRIIEYLWLSKAPLQADHSSRLWLPLFSSLYHDFC